VRKVIDDRPNSELALHVILSTKASLWKEVAVDASQTQTEHIDE